MFSCVINVVLLLYNFLYYFVFNHLLTFVLFLELFPVHNKQEFKLDKNVFHNFIVKDVMTFWCKRNDWNIDDGVINLYSLFDNKISEYSQKWDRSTLTMVIIIKIIIFLNIIALIYNKMFYILKLL